MVAENAWARAVPVATLSIARTVAQVLAFSSKLMLSGSTSARPRASVSIRAGDLATCRLPPTMAWVAVSLSALHRLMHRAKRDVVDREGRWSALHRHRPRAPGLATILQNAGFLDVWCSPVVADAGLSPARRSA